MMVSHCVFSEHEREGEYFEDVPFGNVALVTTAIEDSALRSDERLSVGIVLEVMRVQMLRRRVVRTNLVKAMMIERRLPEIWPLCWYDIYLLLLYRSHLALPKARLTLQRVELPADVRECRCV